MIKTLFLLSFFSIYSFSQENLSTETIKNSNTKEIQTESTKTVKGNFIFLPAKVPISGIVLTPTAYRGKGKNEIGTALDFNAAYYIGRLYGKNNFSWTTDKKNYLDRIGLWFLEADGKMLIQTEDRWKPAMAAGVKGIFQFRDAPQPTLNSPSVSVKVDNKNTNSYACAYISLSKRLHDKFFINAGYADGDFPKFIYQTSEFLSEKAINLTKNQPSTNKISYSQSTLYAGFIWLIKEKMPISAEIIIPQGSVLSPKLINLQLGNLLKLNFQISYLTYHGGWEYLGMFNFRYNYFPKN